MPVPVLSNARSPVQAGTPQRGLDRRRFLTAAALSLGAAASLAASGLPGQAVLALAVPGPDDVTRPPAAYPALFHTRELALGDPLQYLPKVSTLVESLAHPGAAGSDRQARWDALLDSLGDTDPVTQVEAVNRFVNDVRYVDDRRNWGVADRWATPAEFFAQGGDCEDFALAKFVSLHRLGFNLDRLRMVLARDRRKRLDHAFLVVYMGDQAYVLDNQIKTVTAQSAISHYRPLCSFNDHRLWMHRG